jgi:hypothetical protein
VCTAAGLDGLDGLAGLDGLGGRWRFETPRGMRARKNVP